MFIRPATVHINAISLLDVSTDTVSVFVDSNEADGAFDILCTDSYGNQSRQAFASGEETIFTGLTPGIHISISGAKYHGNFFQILRSSRICRRIKSVDYTF